MTIRQAIKSAASTLTAAGIPDPEQDAELIVAHVVGLSRLQARLQAQQPLTPQQEQRYSSLLLSRAKREPLQYLLGEQCFYGLTFMVDRRVLIPRQETETLCEIGISHIRSMPSPTVLDLCTGSGAIAVTLAHECKAATVTATDRSADALAVAAKNAEANNVNVRFLQGDLLAPVATERFDLILSNPPYIPTQECEGLQAEVRREPLMALDGGTDGLSFYRRIAAQAHAYLSACGLLAMEVGDGQAQAVADLLNGTGHYQSITIHNDLYGMARVVSASPALSPT